MITELRLNALCLKRYSTVHILISYTNGNWLKQFVLATSSDSKGMYLAIKPYVCLCTIQLHTHLFEVSYIMLMKGI